MLKKLTAVLLIISVIFSLSSCRYENRISFSELIRRMNNEDICHKLNMEDAFISDNEWFLFVQLDGEDRFIITASENEDSKYIESVSVSVINKSGEELTDDYRKLCKAAAASFMFAVDVNEALTGTGFYDSGMIFSENTRFYEAGRFSLSFFNASLGSTLLIEITR